MGILLMSARPETGPLHAEWLTVAQAAARLGISRRAVQKRCKLGTVVARRLGARWEVAAHGLPTLEPSTVTLEPVSPETLNANPSANLRTDAGLSEPETAPSGLPVRAAANSDRSGAPTEPAAEFVPARTASTIKDATGRDGTGAGHNPEDGHNASHIAHLESEVLFLRALVEQHQKNEAELRAALREALRALPDGSP